MSDDGDLQPRSWKKLALILLLLLSVAAGLLVATQVFQLGQKIGASSAQAELLQVGEEELLHIRWTNRWNTNGLIKIGVWDKSTDEKLWVVQCRRILIDNFTYGRVPSGAVQTFPPGDEKPKLLSAAGHFGVQITHQFDSIIPPAAAKGSFRFEVKISGGEAVIHPYTYTAGAGYP